MGHPCGSTCGRTRCHPVPRRCVPRPVTGPSASVSRRLVVMAIRERAGAKEVRTAVPGPAGGPWVPQAVCQPWGGTGGWRPAVVSAAWHGPRHSAESARTGPSQAAPRGERPCAASGARAPPGTRAGTGGGEAPPQAALAAEGVRIQRQGVPGRSRGWHEQGGEAVLRSTGHRAACLGERQGDQQGRDRQEQRPRRCEPRGGGGMLPRGAMPVRPRMRALRQGTARRTRGERPTQGRGPARGKRLQGGQVAGPQAVWALRPGGRALPSADRGARDPGGPPERRRGLPGVLARPRVPWRWRWPSGAGRGPSWSVKRAPQRPAGGAA